MTKVIPAILEASSAECRRKLQLVRQLTDRVQLDIIDGALVDNRTVQPQDLQPPAGLKVDIHLMVKRPKEYVAPSVKLRPYTIIVQYDGAEDVAGAVEKIKSNGIRAGVAINPDTELDKLSGFIDRLSYILVMAYPAGFAGQKLQTKVLSRVVELRELGFDGEVGLDGGVATESLKKIASAKFDVVNTNSYLFGAENILTRYHELMEVLNT